jgi:hypothetical protein
MFLRYLDATQKSSNVNKDSLHEVLQEAFLCDMCTRWQHRTCYTYISGAVYRPSVRESGDIDWHCSNYIDMPTDYCFSELAL